MASTRCTLVSHVIATTAASFEGARDGKRALRESFSHITLTSSARLTGDNDLTRSALRVLPVM